MIAVISDIHGNYDALKAVLAEIDRLQADTVICLGDIVGYGPEPVACMQEVRRRCDVTLCGNHDFAVIYGAQDFNPVAKATLDYHRSLIMPGPNAGDDNEERKDLWEFLKGLPFRHVRGEQLFVHGSPRNPVVEYLRKMDVLLGLLDKIGQNFKQMDWLCYIGHTHRAGVITGDMKFLEPGDMDGSYQPRPHNKAIVNVGSVGQPRDGDWRACFVTISDDVAVQYHRVEYDVEATADKILATPDIDPILADRLRRGK